MHSRTYRWAVVALLAVICWRLGALDWVAPLAQQIPRPWLKEEAPAPGPGGVWGREGDPQPTR